MNREQIDSRFHRQLDIIHPDKLSFPITIIGAGASGSYTALTLAKMGCTDINIFDDDTVEPHNVSNQVYGEEYLGQPKAVALGVEVNRVTGILPGQFRHRYKDQPLGRDEPKRLVISCVDNMETRKTIWEQAKAQGSRQNPITLIDPRQGGEFIVIYTAKSHGDILGAQAYEETLHPAKESMRLPCTARAVIYNSMLTGALVAILAKKHALGEPLPRRIAVDCSQPGLIVDD
ncbi:MAG: hypothetical protein C4523_18750 [Myxococcales bacterium]|nr:MAG: hypothetical protein C4523_18750 [Myxococcales bacterium]